MTPQRTLRSLPGLLILALLVLATCAQGPMTPDQEQLKTRVREYMTSLFPQFQAIEVTKIEEDDGPFMKATVELESRGNRQKTEVYLTEDGRYLVLGQVWDLNMEPMRARWEQKQAGAKERLASIDLTDRPSRGKEDSPVVFIEFSDYQCPYCSRAYHSLEKQIYASYKDRVKFVFKNLPLESLHPWAKKASIAATCTYVQDADKFWQMHSLLFENQKELTVENLRDKVSGYATQLGLDQSAFMECYDNDKTVSVVETDLHEAQSLGLTSTPTFMINGAVITGVVPLEEMTSYLDYALEDAKDGENSKPQASNLK